MATTNKAKTASAPRTIKPKPIAVQQPNFSDADAAVAPTVEEVATATTPTVHTFESRPGMELVFEETDYIAPTRTVAKAALPNPYKDAVDKAIAMFATTPDKQLTVKIPTADLKTHERWVREAGKAAGSSMKVTKAKVDETTTALSFRAVGKLFTRAKRSKNATAAVTPTTGDAPTATAEQTGF